MGYQVHVWRQHFVLKCFLWWRMSGSLTDVRGTKMNRACFLYYEPDTTHCLVRVKNYWRNLESLTSLGPLYGTAVLRHPSLFWGWSLCRQSLQSCLTLCKPMDCSLPGSSIHGVFPARILLLGKPFLPPGDLPNPGMETASPTVGRFFLLSHRGSTSS